MQVGDCIIPVMQHSKWTFCCAAGSGSRKYVKEYPGVSPRFWTVMQWNLWVNQGVRFFVISPFSKGIRINRFESFWALQLWVKFRFMSQISHMFPATYYCIRIYEWILPCFISTTHLSYRNISSSMCSLKSFQIIITGISYYINLQGLICICKTYSDQWYQTCTVI